MKIKVRMTRRSISSSPRFIAVKLDIPTKSNNSYTVFPKTKDYIYDRLTRMSYINMKYIWSGHVYYNFTVIFETKYGDGR